MTTEKPKRAPGRPKSTEPNLPKPKKEPKITLEEFWKENEEDGVKPSQISKKLLEGLTYEERKRLNPQDLEDLKEIQSLQALADIQMKQKEAIEQEDLHESDLPFEKKRFEDKKWYLKVTRESNAGDLSIRIFVPPFDVQQIQQGVENQYTINITAKDRARITKLLKESPETITFVDGACTGNPG